MRLAEQLIPRFSAHINESVLGYIGTPAHVAARAGNLKLIQLLYHHGMRHNQTNEAGQLVTYTLMQEFVHSNNPYFLNQAPVIFQFLLDDRREKNVPYPHNTDHVSEILDFLSLYHGSLKEIFEVSYYKFREVLMVYFNAPETRELFNGDRSFRALYNLGMLMEKAREKKGSGGTRLAEICLEILENFPDASLHGPASVVSLVKLFLFSSNKLSKTHESLGKFLAVADINISDYELSTVFVTWVLDPKRRKVYPLGTFKERFKQAGLRATIDAAWMQAISTKNKGAVNELLENWPRPTQNCGRNVINAAYSLHTKPTFVDEALRLAFSPSDAGLDGSLLHVLVRSFAEGESYTADQAMRHATLLLHPPEGRQGVDPLVKDRRNRTASQLVGVLGRSKRNWEALQKHLRRFERRRRLHNLNTGVGLGAGVAAQTDGQQDAMDLH